MAWLYRASPSFQCTQPSPRLASRAVSQKELIQLQDFIAPWSHTGSLLQSASRITDFFPVSTESECSAVISTMWNALFFFFFYSAKHVVRRPLSIRFQHIPQFHGVTHLFTQQPPENPASPWASALCGTCVGTSPIEKSLLPHCSCLRVLNRTRPRALTAQPMVGDLPGQDPKVVHLLPLP